jgi:hypothetical protein
MRCKIVIKRISNKAEAVEIAYRDRWQFKLGIEIERFKKPQTAICRLKLRGENIMFILESSCEVFFGIEAILKGKIGNKGFVLADMLCDLCYSTLAYIVRRCQLYNLTENTKEMKL